MFGDVQSFYAGLIWLVILFSISVAWINYIYQWIYPHNKLKGNKRVKFKRIDMIRTICLRCGNIMNHEYVKNHKKKQCNNYIKEDIK